MFVRSSHCLARAHKQFVGSKPCKFLNRLDRCVTSIVCIPEWGFWRVMCPWFRGLILFGAASLNSHQPTPPTGSSQTPCASDLPSEPKITSYRLHGNCPKRRIPKSKVRKRGLPKEITQTTVPNRTSLSERPQTQVATRTLPSESFKRQFQRKEYQAKCPTLQIPNEIATKDEGQIRSERLQAKGPKP